MRIVQINMLHNGSTGKIMQNIANCARNSGHEVWTFSPVVHYLHSKMEMPAIKDHRYFGTRSENMIHRIFDRFLCMNGMFSFFGTRKLLREIKAIEPDIIHLHNLHNLTIDLRSLFKYIKKNKIRVIWTLHDCWAFTGRCPHFSMVSCDRWKSGCGRCPQIKDYPKSYVDMTGVMWHLKKRWFTSAADLTLVTPSKWLKGLLRESYFNKFSVCVINNGIDLDIFKPTTDNFLAEKGCNGKMVVLGVAFDWERRKGLDVFIELSKRLPENYQIVLVGTNEELDEQLPENIVSIHRTQNQSELAAVYSAANVFVNPTREDTFPTVNIESLACGTPVITFDTGGSSEILDKTCGIVVPCDDVDAVERAIYYVCESTPFSQQACMVRAQCFNKQEKFQEYIDLYERLIVDG